MVDQLTLLEKSTLCFDKKQKETRLTQVTKVPERRKQMMKEKKRGKK